MKQTRIIARHLVANLTTRQYGANPTSDLLEVNYWFNCPPDVELPIRIERVDLVTPHPPELPLRSSPPVATTVAWLPPRHSRPSILRSPRRFATGR